MLQCGAACCSVILNCNFNLWAVLSAQCVAVSCSWNVLIFTCDFKRLRRHTPFSRNLHACVGSMSESLMTCTACSRYLYALYCSMASTAYYRIHTLTPYTSFCACVCRCQQTLCILPYKMLYIMKWYAYSHSLHTTQPTHHTAYTPHTLHTTQPHTTQPTHQEGALAAALIHMPVLLPSVSCASTCIGCEHL